MVVMAPGDQRDVGPMLDFSLGHTSPVAIRYPRANLHAVEREVQPIELGQAEIIDWETDGMIIACGAQLGVCLQAAERLRKRYGLAVGVINARFIKPLDRVTIGKAIEEAGFVLTVEEGCLAGGFGSAVLEAANEAGLPTAHVRRLGLPDRFVLHAERDEQLAEVGLDVDGVTKAAVELARTVGLDLTDLGDESDPSSKPAVAIARQNGVASAPAVAGGGARLKP
jgi:1-deoxy-D-xylulose-5-phosphate synthase